MGEKNDPGNFYGTLITGWFFLFFIFIFSKPDATEQVLQFITEICQKSCPRLIQMLELSSVSAECVTSSVAEVINTE